MCKQGAEPLVLSNSWVLCANKLLNLEKNLHVISLYPEWISPSQFLDSYPWIGIQSRKKKQKHISNSSHFLEKDCGQCPIYQLDWGSVTTACITIFLGETGNEDFVPTGLNSIRYNLSVKFLNFSHPKLLLSFKLTLIP